MRIWSKALVPYLPKKQLMAMRYELGDMIKQYPNIKHGLVKFANNYDIAYLGYYFILVCREIDKRNINKNVGYDTNILQLVLNKTNYDTNDLMYLSFKFTEDNEEYLKICLMNLYEKHIRNMIPQEEWKIIEDEFGEVI